MATLNDIKAVPILDILEAAGIEYQHHIGDRYAFLCPAHDDHQTGSCFAMVNKNRWRCYACDAGGDVIALVQAIERIGFRQACNWIAEHCLGEGVEMAAAPRRKTLAPDLLRLIGLSDDTPVYRSINYIVDADRDMTDDADRLTWGCGGDAGPDYYTCDTLITHNPLADLMTEDPASYRALIARKAREAAEKYQKMLTAGMMQTGISDLDRCSAKAAKLGGISAWKSTLENMIRRCEDLIIEYGDEPKPAPMKRRNVYADIRL